LHPNLEFRRRILALVGKYVNSAAVGIVGFEEPNACFF
jgi:hypothetical protein